MKTLIFWLIAFVLLITACTKEEGVSLETLENSSDEFVIEEEASASEISMQLHALTTVSTRSTDPVFFNLGPTVGCPRESAYLFAVKDWYVEPPIAVKLFSPTGKTYYVTMFRSGNYQYRLIRLITQGKWYWRYVYTLNKQPCEPSKTSYWKENTVVRFDGNSAQVAWPFDDQFDWVKTCGHGCNFHLAQYNEYFAQDWACTQGSQSKPFASPLDGNVSKVGWSSNSYGNYVEIDQLVEGTMVRLRIAHLESVAVWKGQPVVAGSTLIGNIGSTGNSSGPHAHCSVFVSTDGQGWENVAFEFVEECEE